VQQYLDGDRDLALRRDLARAHLDAATAAFESAKAEPPARQSRLRIGAEPQRSSASDEKRSIAMREAAAAMALDPSLPGPAELVGRLMLEPPSETPHEVADAVREEDIRTARVNAQAGIWTSVAALAFTPALWWMAPSASSYVALLTALLLLNLVVLLHANLSAMPKPGLVVIANSIIVMVLSRMYSPILVAPGIAAVLAMATMLTPKFSFLGSTASVATMLVTAILTPLALERLDILSQTVSVSESGVLFHGPAIAGYELPTLVVGTVYSLCLVIGAATMGGLMRRRTRDAYRHLQLQAWQLRQLVPQHP
jgi:serine/threonine-protein kinase